MMYPFTHLHQLLPDLYPVREPTLAQQAAGQTGEVAADHSGVVVSWWLCCMVLRMGYVIRAIPGFAMNLTFSIQQCISLPAQKNTSQHRDHSPAAAAYVQEALALLHIEGAQDRHIPVYVCVYGVYRCMGKVVRVRCTYIRRWDWWGWISRPVDTWLCIV